MNKGAEPASKPRGHPCSSFGQDKRWGSGTVHDDNNIDGMVTQMGRSAWSRHTA